MRFHSITFFCDKASEPRCDMILDTLDEAWPCAVHFGETGNSVSMFFASEIDLVRFKNSVNEAYETMRRRL